jgi:hypothetical protein
MHTRSIFFYAVDHENGEFTDHDRYFSEIALPAICHANSTGASHALAARVCIDTQFSVSMWCFAQRMEGVLLPQALERSAEKRLSKALLPQIDTRLLFLAEQDAVETWSFQTTGLWYGADNLDAVLGMFDVFV